MRAAALGLAFAAAAGADDADPCWISLRVEPQRAVVGQLVEWQLEILRGDRVGRVDWRHAPYFPGFRAEWLPGEVESEPVHSDERTFRRSRERRALFPARAGRLSVPPAVLRCDVEFEGARDVVTVSTPLRVIEVASLPEAGRPADFAGLVGSVEVSARLEPTALLLGETARFTVLVEGAGNVWAAADPLDPAALDGFDVFPERPELRVEAGRVLRARRAFRWSLVPRRAGTLRIPALRMPWFDPASGTYRTSETASFVLEVSAERR